jgi:L-lactate dehydrogenase complex protein LldF
VYAGPIGAILTPQLMHMEHSQTLPYASSLCGACYEVCPVKINIPEVLIHLRNKVVEQNGWYAPESLAMKAVASVFRSERRFRAAQRLGRIAESPLVKSEKQKFSIVGQHETNKPGWIGWLPGMLGGWTDTRDLQEMPKETFRDWWEKRGKA